MQQASRVNVNPAALDSSESRIFQSVHRSRQNFLGELSKGVAELVELGHWQAAVNLVVAEGRVSEAELARSLEVMRSTVNRWMSGQTSPQAASMPHMVQKIHELLLA